MQPPGWGPEFLSPVPAGLSVTIGELLAQVASTPPDQARRQAAEALARQPSADPRVRRILAGDRVAEYAAEVLSAAWQALASQGRWELGDGRPGSERAD